MSVKINSFGGPIIWLLRKHCSFFTSNLSYFLINAGLMPVFIPKAVEVNAVSPMVTYTTFYEMPPNSIDVFFMGTSHMYNGISPRYLKEHYGIDSYNLVSSMQSTAIMYFWLKEALNYQTPEVVVFDVYNMISQICGERRYSME